MDTHQITSLFATEQVEETACHHIIRVAFETAADREFDYLVPDEIWPIQAGQRVEAPFGKKDKPQIGFCVETDIGHREPFDLAQGRHRETQREIGKIFKLKKISKVIDKEPLLDSELMELARWISSYYVCP